MESKVIWKNGLSFDGLSGSGFKMPLGTSVESGGANDGFRPMELLLIGLAGCTAMDVISILEKKRQKVHGFEVKVHGERVDEHPRVFKEITLEYIITGQEISHEAVERAVELSETKYCSANAMLKQVAKIDHKITIIEG